MSNLASETLVAVWEASFLGSRGTSCHSVKRHYAFWWRRCESNTQCQGRRIYSPLGLPIFLHLHNLFGTGGEFRNLDSLVKSQILCLWVTPAYYHLLVLLRYSCLNRTTFVFNVQTYSNMASQRHSSFNQLLIDVYYSTQPLRDSLSCDHRNFP